MTWLQITATCIRVPIMRAHAESINLEFERDISEEEAVQLLSDAAGVSIINDRSANRWVDTARMSCIVFGCLQTSALLRRLSECC